MWSPCFGVCFFDLTVDRYCLCVLKLHGDKSRSCRPLTAMVKLGCVVPSLTSHVEQLKEPGALELDLFGGIYTSLEQLGWHSRCIQWPLLGGNTITWITAKTHLLVFGYETLLFRAPACAQMKSHRPSLIPLSSLMRLPPSNSRQDNLTDKWTVREKVISILSLGSFSQSPYQREKFPHQSNGGWLTWFIQLREHAFGCLSLPQCLNSPSVCLVLLQKKVLYVSLNRTMWLSTCFVLIGSYI